MESFIIFNNGPNQSSTSRKNACLSLKRCLILLICLTVGTLIYLTDRYVTHDMIREYTGSHISKSSYRNDALGVHRRDDNTNAVATVTKDLTDIIKCQVIKERECTGRCA